MSRFELSVSPTYVKDWTYVQAVREIFQNALDQEKVNPDNLMSYSFTDEKFIISSRESKLDRSSLLFGSTTKSDDRNLTGQFGEGYKLALLVLCREGYRVTINNYAANERWVPKIIKSKRFNSDLLVIDIEKWRFTSPPGNNLSFVIEGLTWAEFADIEESCLFMQKDINIPTKRYETRYGMILADPKHKGKVFVDGLFICNSNADEIGYGYNFKPQYIKLDRDRSLVGSFDLQWATSRMWVDCQYKDITAKLIVAGAPDVKFIDSFEGDGVLMNKAYDEFTAQFGPTALPLPPGFDIKEMMKKYPKCNFVSVSSYSMAAYQRSSNYRDFKTMAGTITKEKSPQELLTRLADFFYERFPLQTDKQTEWARMLDEMQEESANWRHY